jgi:soluble lytic murein transglycosylase
MKSLLIFIIILLPFTIKAQYHQFEHDIYQNHAQELLGKKSFGTLAVEEISSEDAHFELKLLVLNSLNNKYKHLSHDVSEAILKASKIFRLDPFFLSALIKGESEFNPISIGTSGEIGLMQILPSTAKWIAKKYKFKYKGPESLKIPMENIMIGASYLHYLRKKYSAIPDYYLAAYNMGPGHLRKALAKNLRPKAYKNRVMKRYLKIYNGINKRKKWFDLFISKV